MRVLEGRDAPSATSLLQLGSSVELEAEASSKAEIEANVKASA